MSVRVPPGMATRLAQLAGIVVLTATVAAAPLRGSMDATTRVASVIQRDGFRVSSWNVAESSFVRHPDTFRSVLRIVDADLFLFDEVGDEIDAAELTHVLHGLRNASDTVWHFAWGEGGEYQRGVIASHTPVERVPEFAPLRYPRSIGPIVARETDTKRAALQRNVDGGVGANAAIVTQNERRLLLVTVDLWARVTRGRRVGVALSSPASGDRFPVASLSG